MQKKPAAPLPYQDRFGLSSDDLRKILHIALSRGGDFADLYLEYRGYSSINMEEDIIKDTAESIVMGMGIRVIKGEQTGYGFSNDLAFDKLSRAAQSASAIALSGASAKIRIPREKPVVRNFYSNDEPAHSAPLAKKIRLVQEAYGAAQKHDPSITKVKASLQDMVQYMKIVNSEGLSVQDARPLVRLTCLAIAEKGGQREAGYSGGGGRVGLEYFEHEYSARDIGRDAAGEALSLLEAVPAPAGEMPIILSPGHSGVLVHEAVGHLLEADFNRKKTSIFWNKRGRRVASELVTIYDDPTIPMFRGSYNIDDEGTLPKKTCLIRRGVMVGLLQDRLSARLMKQRPTGHGRRQDFSCWPIPRMSTIYIDAGSHHPEEILRSVKKGFYADRYQGGQVEDSGKFTFSVSSGFLVENGRLTTPVKQATLIGTNIDILKKISMVGTDLKFGLQTGTCSKEGQDIPVSDGCPTIKIARMTVGGSR
ncbi:MAG: TldD/PmbA family protein [Candidatus Aminicenantes bacterium]|nr:TldD/PmbA family protein [Candidatus Aminicenantes bacterium]